MARPLRKESRIDYLGTYIAYVYADGHVETNPEFRPKSKEDVQRERRIEASRERAVAILAAERSKSGLRGSAALPPRIRRENADTIAGKVLFSEYIDLLHRISRINGTACSHPGTLNTLLYTVPLGGQVIGDRAFQRPEFVPPTVTVVAQDGALPSRI